MQHEMMRQPAPVHGSEKVGDVLASIRRLIAQDEAANTIPNHVLNTSPRGTAAAMDGITAETASEPGAPATDAWPQDAGPDLPQADETPAGPLPLILNNSDLIAPGFPDTGAAMPVETGSVPAPEPEPEPDHPPLVAAADIRPDEAAAPAPEPAPEPDPVPAPIAADQPEAAPAFAAAPRPDFDLGALWLDPPAPDWPASAGDADDGPGPDAPDLPVNDMAPPSLNIMQPEENMLQANASVTPINPHIDPGLHADPETLRDGGEPHLFAPQDKGAQKGAHLRGMIREAIRQELQGEIGNRLSRNLQQMIRHEIELTLRQMCEQE